jgi:predicted RNA binding protein YcfA (HicA-like mRNA interferase family)
MLKSSRDIKRRLQDDGWILDQVKGSHCLSQPDNGCDYRAATPEEGLGTGLVHKIYKQANWNPDRG